MSSWRCAVILNEPAAQKEAINLAGLLANVNPYNLSKPDIHRRAVATNDDILEAFSGLRIGLRILINPKFFSSFATSTRTREGEFCASIKKGSASRSDHQHRKPCYIFPAGVNPPAGRENPCKHMATQDAPSVFFIVVISAHLHSAAYGRTISMVALVGQPKGWPVSLCAGFLTPASVTAPYECENSGGDSLNLHEEAARMATTPTQKPQFIWIIAAVRRDMPTITAKIHHIAAETEKEARRSLAQDHVCFFAGRIRLEVAA
ncbi:ash family protein [Escherichia coli]|nr:ash family protein [Escherichia coli]